MSEGGRGAHIVQAFAPGRTELAGNHTDHEGGLVIAAALGVGIQGTFVESDSSVVRVESEGFVPCVIDLADPNWREPHADERTTTQALLRGMLSQLAAVGVALRGFEAHLKSTLPAGGGLSSSAAFELLIGVAGRELFAPERTGAEAHSGGLSGTAGTVDVMGVSDEAGPLGPIALARMGQRAETDFFGKPCGLMDQLAVACGGIVEIDLADPQNPRVAPIEFDLAARDYALVLVDVGCDHSRFTQEYAAVPAEMHAVARLCGVQRLCEVSRAEVLARAQQIRGELGDRAFLRALHFYRENALTVERSEALRARDLPRFLRLTRESGASSAMYLQNVSSGGTYQPAMVALAVAETLLDEASAAHGYRRGACRIHGGGFGGSIQAFVPAETLDEFISGMEGVLGQGCCLVLTMGGKGAWAQ